MAHRVVLVALIFALAQAEVSCAPAGSGPTATCIPSQKTVYVASSADVSSVTVKPGGTAIDERTGGMWCDLTELALAKLVVDTEIKNHGCPSDQYDMEPPCAEAGILAALDLRPTPVKFPDPAFRPTLTYDLAANPPNKEAWVLMVYQLRVAHVAGLPDWYPIGSPTRTGTLATLDVGHFSVFALVELPPPEAIPAGGADAGFIVASEFIAGDQATISVQLVYVKDRVDTSRQLREGVSPLFRFSGFEPVDIPTDAGCTGETAELLTCLFPVTTEVRLQVGADRLVVLERVDDGFRVEFMAAVEIL